MSNSVEVWKRSYTTLFYTIQKKVNPTDAFSSYDLTSTTANWGMSQNLGDPPLLWKSSTASSEILYTSTTGGQIEVYLSQYDTDPFAPGKYFFSVYVTDAVGKTYNVITDKINLKDDVDILVP
jgi:hypothetical protein